MTDTYTGPGRYRGLEIAVHTAPDGVARLYLRRRWIAAPDAFPVVGEHVVTEDDRLDRLAARYLDDPTRYWQLADAHAVLDASELTAVVGSVVRITLPPGSARPDDDE